MSLSESGSGNGHSGTAQLPISANPNRRGPAPGSRLADAFEAIERYPVLVSSRDRIMRAATADTARTSEIIETVEADIGLAIQVLRVANRGVGRFAGQVASVPAAIDILKPAGVLALAGTAPSYDFFEPITSWEVRPEHVRIHGVAVQRAAERISRSLTGVDKDELALAALLHDIGRLVVTKLHPGPQDFLDANRGAPEERLRAERERLGIDHALVGGVLVRRWSFPQRLALAIERHHAEDAEGLAAIIGCADMLAHYAAGEMVSGERLTAAADRCGLSMDALREILYELPSPRPEQARTSEPCPLSARELDVLRHLSGGMVYKQIAGEMHLSVSTIRTHLHNVYGKIGAVDRAQAVLTARDRGWI